MIRPLLVLSFALFAADAIAAEAAQANPETSGCPKSEVAPEKAPANETSGTTARPGTPAPVRPRSTTVRGTPRWHSLLPGMIR
ncbi:hypothetical protein [Arenimonas daejeonensis]|uniref:hypothetical protein n=1 Tax=Arenimonas daejeonensis TaxID=370777 RepID=UPI0011BDAE8C|nr:hypothetical protein [Arenimonas daejeonensis]